MANFNIAYLIELKDRYTQVAKKIAQVNQKMRDSVAELSTKMTNFGNSLDNIKGKFKSIGDKGRDAFVGWSVPVGLAIGSVVKLGAELEDTRMVFTTMLGSAEKASKMVSDVQQMASKTPFGTQELLDATKMMLNFGIAEQDVMKNLEMLGNISGGNKQRFQSLSLAFSQVASQGKLTGQDLLQMINAGFNPLQVLSEKTGKSMGELKDIMSKGGITFAMVAKSMELATSKGGRFYQLMAKQSTTLNGLMSTLADNFALAGAKIGEKLLPYIKPLVIQLIKMTEGLANLNPKMTMIIVAFAGLSALIPVVMMVVGFLGQTFISFVATLTLMNNGILKVIMLFQKWNVITKIATAVQWLFNTSLYGCPIVWIIAGIIAVIAIIVLLVKNWDTVTKAVQNFGAWAVEVLSNFWAKIVEVFGSVKTFIQENFIKILLTALGPIGLIIQGIMKVKDLIGQVGDSSLKVEQQINAQDVSTKNRLDGEITVKAEQGTKVTNTKSKVKGTGKANVGINRAGAGR